MFKNKIKSVPYDGSLHPHVHLPSFVLLTDDGDDDGGDDDKRALKGRAAGLVYSLEKPSLSPDNNKLPFNCSAIGKTV